MFTLGRRDRWTDRLRPAGLLVYLEIDFVRLRKDRNRRGGGMDPPLRLRGGDPLDAVHAGLELQARVGPVARTSAMISLKPPASDSEVDRISTFHRARSA